MAHNTCNTPRDHRVVHCELAVVGQQLRPPYFQRKGWRADALLPTGIVSHRGGTWGQNRGRGTPEVCAISMVDGLSIVVFPPPELLGLQGNLWQPHTRKGRPYSFQFVEMRLAMLWRY